MIVVAIRHIFHLSTVVTIQFRDWHLCPSTQVQGLSLNGQLDERNNKSLPGVWRKMCLCDIAYSIPNWVYAAHVSWKKFWVLNLDMAMLSRLVPDAIKWQKTDPITKCTDGSNGTQCLHAGAERCISLYFALNCTYCILYIVQWRWKGC